MQLKNNYYSYISVLCMTLLFVW